MITNPEKMVRCLYLSLNPEYPRMETRDLLEMLAGTFNEVYNVRRSLGIRFAMGIGSEGIPSIHAIAILSKPGGKQ